MTAGNVSLNSNRNADAKRDTLSEKPSTSPEERGWSKALMRARVCSATSFASRMIEFENDAQ
jgi:hypothetical protein